MWGLLGGFATGEIVHQDSLAQSEFTDDPQLSQPEFLHQGIENRRARDNDIPSLRIDAGQPTAFLERQRA